MDDSWVTLISLGIAASFMPSVFGVEIYALGGDDGVKKVSSFLVGITSFRLMITIGVVFLFAGVMTSLTQQMSDIGQLLRTLLSQFGEGVTSGHHLLIDLLLIVAGVLMIIQALRHLRSGSKAAQTTQSSDSKALSVGVIGMLGLGLMMTATNVNQWVFTAAAVNELIRMDITPWGRLLAFLLFLMLSSMMIVLPLVLVLARPQNVKGDLEKVNGWINGSMRTIAVGILVLIGLFLIAKGGTGVLNSMSG